ncbi:ATP-binding protein [Amycolatopsis sp. A133]|uniref:ATP-binding protein n=1 Tax=Amycolatopsis sp. A133 TaxID=3064472 RepID=UPI0027FC65CD|nr:ATP-binding protein [Amycolatopsis sp. A133]MDQ7809102.1 ATP-binding protein [Amycolatopsis sp. A133]
MRLTLVYGALCLLSGVVLIGLVFLLSGQTLAGHAGVILRDAVGTEHQKNVAVVPKGSSLATAAPLSPGQINELAGQLRDEALRQLFLASSLAIGAIVVFACAVGWWVAGRVLRPLHAITEQARSMSVHNIHERIALPGPPDELRRLADTFDDMLERLERSFTSQRRFVANASHELRTPLAVERATIQVRLAAPGPADLADVRADLLAANRRLENLLDGLLLLARSDHGLDVRHPVDMAATATRLAGQYTALPPAAAPPGTRIQVRIDPLVVMGDEGLLTQLVENLLRNALSYNHSGGWVSVQTHSDGRVVIANSGPPVPVDTVDSLFEPFQRGGGRGLGDGAGLGLAIVRSITRAHGGTVSAEPRVDGGLVVTARFAVLAAK